MRKLIKYLFIPLFGLSTAQADIQWSVMINKQQSETVGTLTEDHSENILRILESMPWIEEGSQTGEGKYLYVIYSPSSEESQKLYQQTRTLLEDVNIRWIPIQQKEFIIVDGLYETRTPEALKNAMTTGTFPTIENTEKTTLISNMVLTGFVYLRALNIFSPESLSYFPTVIYGGSEKLLVHPNPSNIADIVPNIPVTTPTIQDITMDSLSENSYKVYPVREFAYFINEENSPATVTLYPAENGISLGTINNQLPIKGITDNGYMAIDIRDGNGQYLFIKYFNDDVEINAQAKAQDQNQDQD